MELITNDECVRLLGHIKHLRDYASKLASDKDIIHWREESRSYAAELATELLRLNPYVRPIE